MKAWRRCDFFLKKLFPALFEWSWFFILIITIFNIFGYFNHMCTYYSLFRIRTLGGKSFYNSNYFHLEVTATILAFKRCICSASSVLLFPHLLIRISWFLKGLPFTFPICSFALRKKRILLISKKRSPQRVFMLLL